MRLTERATVPSTRLFSESVMSIVIETFRPEHAPRFRDLNREWLEAYDLMEPSNDEQLADPQAYFIDRGGRIFVALHDGDVVGTAAMIPHGVGEFELAKVTVASTFRGQGIARRLVEHCIAYAREQNARRVSLVSNSRLQPALRLYESMGFEHRALATDKEYEHQDVSMVLDLGASNESG